MKARVVCLIEVEVGGVRRYFTPDGESVGIASPDAAPVPDETPMSAEELIAMVPKKRRYVPPFNPGEIPVARPGEVDLEVEV